MNQPAIIDPNASIGEGTTIGEGCVIGKHVSIGKHNTIASYVIIDGHTTIGDHNHIGTHSVLGTAPQDIKTTSSEVGLNLGDHNEVGAYVLISAGTDHGGRVTVIGDHNRLMDHIHIGHDVQMGNHCQMDEKSALGGHMIIQDYVYFGEDASVHQFVEIGEYARIAEGAALTQDIPPFCVASGNRAKITGLHTEILHQKFSHETVQALTDAYGALFRGELSPKEQALKAVDQEEIEPVKKLYQFITNSKRGIPFRRNMNVNEKM